MTPYPDDVGGFPSAPPPAPRLVPPTYSGTFIHPIPASIARSPAYEHHDDLATLARAVGRDSLAELLESSGTRSTRAVSVSPELVRELERNPPPDPSLPSLADYYRLDLHGIADVNAFLAEFVVRLGPLDDGAGDPTPKGQFYYELAVSEPFADPADDPLALRQRHLDPAPVGIGARGAWQQGLDGKGARLVDLEQGWITGHEDLVPGFSVDVNDNRDGVLMKPSGTRRYAGHHGAAVLSVAVGADNDRGVIGVAPGTEFVRGISHYKSGPDTDLHVSDAIVRGLAQGTLASGTVLLLEVQRGRGLPTEVDQLDFLAIHLAARRGVVVIEAAGNGGRDLDEWTADLEYGGSTQLFPSTLDPHAAGYLDSRATLVGAACPQMPHDRWRRSNFGRRVDCYGWGAGVVSAGYGDLGTRGTPRDRTYTSRFGGTSAAAAMVAGAALVVQGARAGTSGILDSTRMRQVLSRPDTGTPQGPNQRGSIGVMPDLEAIVEQA